MHSHCLIFNLYYQTWFFFLWMRNIEYICRKSRSIVLTKGLYTSKMCTIPNHMRKRCFHTTKGFLPQFPSSLKNFLMDYCWLLLLKFTTEEILQARRFLMDFWGNPSGLTLVSFKQGLGLKPCEWRKM